MAVQMFLDPNNHNINYSGLTKDAMIESCHSADSLELALQHVSMFIRSTNDVYQVVEPLLELGWRHNKNYFLVSKNGVSKDERYLLTWVETTKICRNLCSNIVFF